MRPRLTLAGQILALQLMIVLLVVVVVGAVSLAQSTASFQHTEGRRLLSVAETVAAMPSVRNGLTTPVGREALPGVAETARGFAAQSSVLIIDADRVLLSGPDIGDRTALGVSPVLQGRSWIGTTDERGATSLVAHAPVHDEDGRVIGLVAVGRGYPTFPEQLAAAAPNLVLYLLIGGLLGVAGSVLLARRVKRQTLGLEPRQIANLVEHREAMLHGIREGVLGVDAARRVTLANDEALRLLGLGQTAIGRDLGRLDLESELVDVLTGAVTGTDQVVLCGDRILVLNRMPITTRGRPTGAVVTLRDRTELVALQRELDVSRNASDTLRAQAHEFTNQLHTIAGLVELGEYDEVARYVHRASKAHDELTREVASRIEDPSLAALLVAKASLAAEHGVRLRLAERSALSPVDEALSADLLTVVGNLVDNALDAVRQIPEGWVEVGLDRWRDGVRVVVRDCGPGVEPDVDVFRHGYSTKADDQGHLGLGLPLARLVCTRRGGDLTAHNDDGAVFTAQLPAGAATTAGARP